MDPSALNELVPDWRERGAPLDTPVQEDRFSFLSENGGLKVPNILLPGSFLNHGNFVVSLGEVCRWLAKQAEDIGVEFYAGFAGSEVLYDANGAVRAVATGDMGVLRDGTQAAPTSQAWNCWPNIPCSRKAAAGILASSWRLGSACAMASTRRFTASGLRCAVRHLGRCVCRTIT